MIKVSFTNHAKDMLKERKFTEEEIVFALSERDWSENDEIETKNGMHLKNLVTRF